MSLDYISICYIGSRIGRVSVKEIFKSGMGVEMIIMGNCPITIPPMVHTYKYLEAIMVCTYTLLRKLYRLLSTRSMFVCNSHTSFCIIFVTAGGVRDRI